MMNKWILTIGLMVMVSWSSIAQRKSGERLSVEERSKRSTKRMAEELALTPGQKVQISDVNIEYAKKDEVEMAERRVEAELRKAEVETVRAEMKEQEDRIPAVSTKEQSIKWTELKIEKLDDPRQGRPNAQIESDPRKARKSNGK